MPFQASFEVEAGKNWGFYEPSTRYILDTFNRAATSGTLGTSTNGQMWNQLIGSWYVNGSYQAESDNGVTSGTGSTYSLATYDLVDINQLAYANISPGMGVAFSVQNANNWWAITDYDYNYSYSCNCSTCSYSNTCTYCSLYCTSCGICGSFQEDVPPYNGGCLTCCCGTTDDTSCAECGETGYSCCSTCTNYTSYLTILQCVNGTVNTITLNTSSSSPVADASSISLQLQNGTLNYYAYSTNISGIVTHPYGLGTVMVSGSMTISGTFGTQVGMIKSPSYYIQGTTISGFYGTGL